MCIANVLLIKLFIGDVLVAVTVVALGSFKPRHAATMRTASIKKINLHFAYESSGTLKSFTLFSTVKAITKLNPGHSDKFEMKV